jgi:hypothetical protein
MNLGNTSKLLITATAIAASTAMASAGLGSNAYTGFSLDLIQMKLAKNAQYLVATDLQSSMQSNMSSSIAQMVDLADTDYFAPLDIQSIASNAAGDASGNIPNSQGNAQGRGRTQAVNNTLFSTKEDNLNVVPLPPAAFAALGMLMGIAGIRSLKKNG